MPRKDKVIHISNLPSTFRGNVTRNGRFIQNGIPPLGGVYDKVVKSTGLSTVDLSILKDCFDICSSSLSKVYTFIL